MQIILKMIARKYNNEIRRYYSLIKIVLLKNKQKLCGLEILIMDLRLLKFKKINETGKIGNGR